MRFIRKCSLGLLFVLLFSVMVLAAQYGSAYDLFAEWEANGYPDYVGGVSSLDGGSELVILLVEGQEEKAEELQALVAQELNLAYGAKYSHNELTRINDEIVQEYMINGDGKVVGCGVGWTVVDGEVTGFGESGRESRVTVSVLDDAAQEYAGLFYGKYGDAVVVESTGGITATTEDMSAVRDELALDSGRTHNPGVPLWLRLLIFAFVLCTALWTITLRRRDAQTAGQVRESKPAEPKTDFEDLKKKL